MSELKKIYQVPRIVRFAVFYLFCVGLGLAYGMQALPMAPLLLIFFTTYSALLLPECLAATGAWYIRLGRMDAGLKFCELALSLEPNNYIATVNQGFAYYKRGLNAQASASFDRAIALKPKKHLSYINRAATRIAMHDYEGAITDATTAIAFGPHDTRAHINKTVALMGQHRFADALDLLEQLRPHRKHADFMAHNRMVCKTQLSRLDEAEQEWLGAGITSPKLLHLGKTWLAHEKSNYEEVLTLTSDIRDDDPDSKVYLFLRSCCYTFLGEGEMAVRTAFQLLQDQRQSKLGPSALAVAFMQAGLLDEALDLSNRLEAFDADSLQAPLIRASVYLAREEYQTANEAIEIAIERCPTDISARALKIAIDCRSGFTCASASASSDSQAALAAAEAISRRHPQSHLAWLAAGEAHLACKHLEEALGAFKQATTIMRYSQYACMRLAHNLLLLGREDEANATEARAAAIHEQFVAGVERALQDFPISSIAELSQPPQTLLSKKQSE